METKQTLSALIAATLLIFTSCNSGTNLYKGNYTFKTSGAVELEVTNSEANTEADTISADMVSEFGQMEILTTDKKSGEMLLTMDIFGGDVLTIPGIEKKGVLTLDTIRRTTNLRIGDTKFDNVRLDMTGFGEKYDNTIIFTLSLSGSFSGLLNEYEIVSSDIRCVATENQ